MIPSEFDYVAPASFDDALRLLGEGGEDAKLLAGGHSLIPLMKLRLAVPSLLIDLRHVSDLRGIDRTNGDWRIGALTRHAELQAKPEMGLASVVAGTIANQQVRNRGTIGGSLAHGDSASDLPTVLLAAEGAVVARGPGGEREVAAGDLFLDYLTTALEPNEIVTQVRLPALDGSATPTRSSRGAPRTGRWWASAPWSSAPATAPARTSAWRSRTWARRRCARRRSRMRCAAARSTPTRRPRLRGRRRGDRSPGDLNATPEYKRHLARVLTRRALTRAAG